MWQRRDQFLANSRRKQSNLIRSVAEMRATQERRSFRKCPIQTLSARKRVLGEEHPDTLRVMCNLASTYSISGHHSHQDLQSAASLAKNAFIGLKEKLGDNHRFTSYAIGVLKDIQDQLIQKSENDNVSLLTLQVESENC